MLKLLNAFPVYTTCFSFLPTPQRIITKFAHKKFENLPPHFHLQILFSHLKHFLILLSFISVSSVLILGHLLCQIKDANKYLILTNFISHLFPLKLPAHHLYNFQFLQCSGYSHCQKLLYSIYHFTSSRSYHSKNWGKTVPFFYRWHFTLFIFAYQAKPKVKTVNTLTNKEIKNKNWI